MKKFLFLFAVAALALVQVAGAGEVVIAQPNSLHAFGFTTSAATSEQETADDPDGASPTISVVVTVMDATAISEATAPPTVLDVSNHIILTNVAAGAYVVSIFLDDSDFADNTVVNLSAAFTVNGLDRRKWFPPIHIVPSWVRR